MMNNNYDCLVIGAGPAGTTTAALVAEHGWSTLLVERDAMPRFHVGESLMPESYWTFQRLGLLDKLQERGFVKKNGVQFVNHHDKESRPFFFQERDPRDCSVTWHVQRGEFDQALFEIAADKGAECLDQTRVLDVELSEDGPHQVTLKTKTGNTETVSTRVLVDATGQQSFLANRLGLKVIAPDLKKAAIWGYYRDALRNGEGQEEVTCILHTQSKNAWFWYIPLSDGTVSVGVVADNDYLLKGRSAPEEVFQQELAQCPGVQRRVQGCQLEGKLNVAKEFSYSTTQHAGPGWVLVGDAYGFIDPIYSSGVFLALKSGELAADAIHQGLQAGDLSAQQLGGWTDDFDEGVVWIRKLVHAFYTREFSFGEFMKAFPHHQGNLTDLLVGRVFEGEPGKIFDDMDPWIESLKDPTQTSTP